MSSDKCPACGANRSGSYFGNEGPPIGVRFACGTGWIENPPTTHQSDRCKIAQLTRERDELQRERDELRKTTPTCEVCNWTNTGCLKVSGKWTCHGCLDAMARERDELRVELQAARGEVGIVAYALYDRYFRYEAPDWKFSDDLAVAVTQVSNMVAGLEDKLTAERAAHEATKQQLRECQSQAAAMLDTQSLSFRIYHVVEERREHGDMLFAHDIKRVLDAALSTDAGRELLEEVERLRKELAGMTAQRDDQVRRKRESRIKNREVMERLRPLCPDCRDKCKGYSCLRCEIQRLEREVERLRGSAEPSADLP